MEGLFFKTFGTMSENEMEKAIEFVLSREEQEYFTLNEDYEDEITPEKYVFIIEGTSVIGIFSFQLKNRFEFDNSTSDGKTLNNVLEIDDFRLATQLSVKEKAALINFLFEGKAIKKQNLKFKNVEYFVLSPSLSKLSYFEKISQGFSQGQLVCYKKI